MKENTITPLLKESTQNPDCLDNYRAISLSSLENYLITLSSIGMSKFLQRTRINMPSSHKARVITVHLFLTKTMKYYASNGSNPIICFLDMHKAFDQVNIMTIFEKLCLH